MEAWIGTSGFAYKPWDGVFYPEGIKDPDRLQYYGTRLPAVEIDNTFYRMPKKSVLESWAAAVPEDFRFSIKASRRITHFGRLKNVEEPMGFLMENVKTLGEKLGSVLFQMPPNVRQDLPRLEAFLPLIPEDVPAAFEFRHDSWFRDDTYELLRRHGRALCQADTDGAPDLEIIECTNWGYLRLRRSDYSSEELDILVDKLSRSSWDSAQIFLKHEDAAIGPKRAEELLTRLGRPGAKP